MKGILRVFRFSTFCGLILSLCLAYLTACRTPATEPLSSVRESSVQSSGVFPTVRRQLSGFSCPEGAGPVKVIFFDADSTLRISRSGAPSANGPDDVFALPFVAAKMRDLADEGTLIAIASNQGGVPQYVSLEDAQTALSFAAELATRRGGVIHYMDFAARSDGGDFRKPATGMAMLLEDKLAEACPGASIDRETSIMVGDAGYKRGVDGPHPDGRPADDFSNSDRGFAEALGIAFVEPSEFFGWRDFGVYNFHKPADLESFVGAIEVEARHLAATGLDEARGSRLSEEAKFLRQVNPRRDALTYVHYNIRELKTSSLVGEGDNQAQKAAQVLSFFDPDFVSINEMQYDKPDVPRPETPGTGRNLNRLLSLAGLEGPWQVTFAEALTGRHARKDGDAYVDNPNSPQGRQLGDQINFGVFPGQYSTAFGSKESITKRHIFPEVPADVDEPLQDRTRVTWQDWNPEIDLGAFQSPSGDPYPQDVELFDKNFNDSVVEINGQRVHFVTFHTVPAFNFGNPRAPNVQRNGDQLAFLEWYLTGQCEEGASSPIRGCRAGVRPLRSQESDEPRFIAVGDLNVDLHADKPGAEVMGRLLDGTYGIHKRMAVNYDPAFHRQEDKVSHVTYSSKGVDLGRLQEQLDYFLVSDNLKVDAMFVYTPKSDFAQGECFAQRSQAQQNRATFAAQNPGLDVSISRRYGADLPWCVVGVSAVFAQFRQASDHYPVVLRFHL